MNRHRKAVFSLILTLPSVFLLAPRALATTYYISRAGSDTNTGKSEKAPWQTLAKANSITFAPGDRILLKGGELFTGSLFLGSADRGTSMAPITVSSYGRGKPTIQTGDNAGITIYDTGDIDVKNIDVEGNWSATALTGNTSYGILAYNDLSGGVQEGHIRIIGCEASGCEWAGIQLESNPTDGSQSGFAHVEVSNCTCHDDGFGGIVSSFVFDPSSPLYAFGDVKVSECSVYDIRGIQNLPSQSGQGIDLSGVNGGVIERCIAHDDGDLESPENASGGPVGIWFWGSNDCRIEHCEAYNNHTGSFADGDGFDLDGGCTNCIMQYNYSHDNDGAGFLMAQFAGARPYHDNTVRYNISQNDCRKITFAGIALWNGGSGISDCQVYNNTVYMSQPADHGVYALQILDSTLSEVDFRNNILIAAGGATLVQAPAGQDDVLFQGNDYWEGGAPLTIDWEGQTFSDLPSWRTTGEEMVGTTPVGMSVDPRLNDAGGGETIGNPNFLDELTAYQLQPGSPMIDAGLNLTEPPFKLDVGSTDFYGVPIPQGNGYDIGASEYARHRER